MSKRIKMLVYGEPGVGKSTFASKAPKPFFITTDGNYEWLEDFGAKEEDHKQIFSWEEAKKLFEQNFDGYDTIVVDLLEDLFKWCEQEYCKRAKIEHVSDVGYGKGYDISRNEFFLEISKLLGKDKNIILLSHSYDYTTKDRRGVEHSKHMPSNRIPDKVLDMIEGRLRYCLRCYLVAEEQEDGTLLKKRMLSLIPKENEFGICRGIDEATTPHDIPLEWDAFAKAIKYDNTQITGYAAKVIIVDDTPLEKVKPVPMEQIEKAVENSNIVNLEETKAVQNPEPTSVEEVTEQTTETTEQVVEQTEQTTNVTEANPLPFDDVKPTVKEQPVAEPAMSNADKLAAIKAKLAQLRASQN